LCGKEHAYMPINVQVVSAKAYSAWVEEQQKAMAALADDPAKVWELDALVARGKQVYGANCAACHQANGKGAGPIKALDGSAIVLNTDHTEVISSLLNGRANGAMPAWKQLSDTEIAAVITYAKNSWTNQSGDLVQPSAVQAARNQ
jgi:cytochrome c oxidase subunit II